MTNQEFETILGQIGPEEPVNDRLMTTLYAELHGIANRLMGGERRTHTLQPTALVHEAFLRLIDAEKVGEKGRLHFLDAAAVTMRRVLVDHARRANAVKRGSGTGHRVTLSGIPDEESNAKDLEDVNITLLDAALSELEQLDERQAKIVELRFFAGMSGDQIAAHCSVSRSTVVRELTFSRAWLQRWIKRHEG